MTVEPAGLINAHDTKDGRFSTVRTKIDQGDMVLWLPRSGEVRAQTVGAGNVVRRNHQFPFGSRQAPGCYEMVTDNASATAYAQGDAGIIAPFAGRRISLVTFQRPDQDADFDVAINGKVVLMASAQSRLAAYDQTATNFGPVAGAAHWPLVDDLPTDGPHVLDLRLRTPASGSKSLRVLGFMVESRMGYREAQPVDALGTPLALTTSYQTAPFQVGTTSIASATGVAGWIVPNGDNIPHNVSLRVSINSTQFVTRTVTVAAGATVEIPAGLSALGRPLGVDSDWTIKANEALNSAGTLLAIPQMAL